MTAIAESTLGDYQVNEEHPLIQGHKLAGEQVKLLEGLCSGRFTMRELQEVCGMSSTSVVTWHRNILQVAVRESYNEAGLLPPLPEDENIRWAMMFYACTRIHLIELVDRQPAKPTRAPKL